MTCVLDSEGTDRLVELVREAGPDQGLFGAKITGGGSGGTVAVIGRKGTDGAIEAIADAYASETGHKPHIFSGSSLGAGALGARSGWQGKVRDGEADYGAEHGPKDQDLEPQMDTNEHRWDIARIVRRGVDKQQAGKDSRRQIAR